MKNIIISFIVAAFSVGVFFVATYYTSAAYYEEQLALTLASLQSSGVSYVLYESEDNDKMLLTYVNPDELAIPETPFVKEPAPAVAGVQHRDLDVVEESDENKASDSNILKDKLARAVFIKTNEVRKDAGLSQLLPEEVLTSIAKNHSKDMAEQNFFAHADGDGCTLTCRLEYHEYNSLAWAENISQVKKRDLISTEEIASLVVEGWMKSGGHRENILNNEYTHTGIGVAYDGRTVFVTADYAQQK